MSVQRVKELPFEIQLERALLEVESHKQLVQGLETQVLLNVGTLKYQMLKDSLDSHKVFLVEREESLKRLYDEADSRLTERN